MKWRSSRRAATCFVVVSAKKGRDYEDDLDPVIGEAEDLSLGEVWTG